MIFYPNAKINIGLEVLRKRNDGYHDLETIFYPIGLSDILEINFSDEFCYTQTGINFEGDHENNIVIKAYRLLQHDFKLKPVAMHLHKMIPIGAGLGGGSSDAAFTLKGLNELFGLQLTSHQLEQYATKLGSDCAFFIKNEPAFATGRGEIMEPINVSIQGHSLVLIKPDSSVGTAEAYANIQGRVPQQSLKNAIRLSIEKWKTSIENRFELSVFKTHPEIAVIKQKLYDQGAIYASMSGSGSSVYGIFEKGFCLNTNIFEDCFVWHDAINTTDF